MNINIQTILSVVTLSIMFDKSSLLLIPIVTITIVLSLSISNVNALTNANNTDFSIDIPDDWVYKGNLFSKVELTPNEFGVFIINDKPWNEQMNETDTGAVASFEQDWLFPIKNAGLDLYVKFKVDKQNAMQVTSKQNVTIDNETAVKIYADGINSLSGIKFVEYMTMHNKEPFYIGYMAKAKDFQRYLPEFEQIAKSFKFMKK